LTFSIVARDPDTGDLGVAVTTGVPCVGAVAELLRVYDAARASAEALEAFYDGSIVIRPLTWRIVR
jgi:uncharacterized Ntn-hydrolase superfamily protein